MSRTIGIILLIIFLALYGLLAISNVHFEQEQFLLGLTALASAVFLALGK